MAKLSVLGPYTKTGQHIFHMPAFGDNVISYRDLWLGLDCGTARSIYFMSN